MEQHEVDGILEEVSQKSRGASNRSQPNSKLTGSMALMLVAGIAATGAFATLFAVWYRSGAPGEKETLRIALDEYVAGRYVVAKRLAERVEPDMEASPENYSVREFLLGAAGVQLASKIEDPGKMRLELAAAVPHLEWLAGTGFPPGRTAEGQQLLGLGQLSLGRYEAAIVPLGEAIAEDPTLSRELLLPLAESKLRATGVKASRAEDDVNTFLALPNLSSDSIQEAYLLKARIDSKMRNFPSARKSLGKVTKESMRDEVDLILAETYIDEAKTLVAEYAIANPEKQTIPLPIREMLDEAAAVLEDLNHRNEMEFGSSAKYLAGIAYRIAGRNEEALGVLSALRQNSKQPAEAIAAGMEEVEILTEMQHYGDALLASRAIVREIGDPTGFDPKWLSLVDLQSRLQGVGQAMRKGGGYAESIDYARALPPVVDPADALEMKADSHRQWGDDLRRANVNGGEEIKVKAREQFREAGKTFSEVAKMRFEDPEYVELLWKAIDAYQAGRSFEESLVLLDEYLQYEDRTKHPRGLIAKGKALTAVGRPEQSLVPLTDCIAEFPRDSLSYEARLLSAVGLAELGRTNEARLLLEENVQDQWLSPESPVYRDSLYVLGDLLHRQAFGEYLRLTSPTLVAPRLSPGDQTNPELAEAFHANQRIIEAAIVTLEDAEQRDQKYGNLERSRRAAYLAAEAHRLAAYWPGIQAADPDTLQSARNQLNQLRAAELARANAGYNRLRNLLGNEMSSRDELLPWEQAMLRNCFMGVADTLFEMNDIAAAATAYQKASQEFMNEPLALEALMQQSRCYEKLGKLEEAKKIYKQAAVILDRIPTEEDHRFAQTTRYDRKDWIELLNWLQGT